MNANTCSIEDVINTLDPNYRLSGYLSLRGHVAYKAAKLAGQYLAKSAKIIFDMARAAHELDSDAPLTRDDIFNIHTFGQAMAHIRGQEIEDLLLDEAGLSVTHDMLHTLRQLVAYANKLNYDMQDMVDPNGTRRLERGFKMRGVYFNETEKFESWQNSVQLLADADSKNKLAASTYAEYAATIDNPDWRLTEAEWNAAQDEGQNLYGSFGADIVSFLMDLGDDECQFDELDIRSQIAAIENMRGKIGKLTDSALRSVKYNRDIGRDDKVAEATKIKGMIKGFDQAFCNMLDSSRYANHTEFMYNYSPKREGATPSAPIGRRMIAKTEERLARAATARVDDKTAHHINGTYETEYLADLKSDVV